MAFDSPCEDIVFLLEILKAPSSICVINARFFPYTFSLPQGTRLGSKDPKGCFSK